MLGLKLLHQWKLGGSLLMVVLIAGCPQPPPAGCTGDAECDDGDACTVDTCNTATGECAHADECPPVSVSVSIEGDPTPGSSVTATATVDARDGSTVESYAWSQANSVAVTIDGAGTAAATVGLPDAATYKNELLMILVEPPIGEDDLPPNVHIGEEGFVSGLQDRFGVVGLNPFVLEEAGHVGLMVTVTTTSGVYTASADIHTALPWKVSTGLRNVPVGRTVLLHGMTQDTYDWALTGPAGSGATLMDETSQDPYFTPDLSGTYTVMATNTTVDPAEDVTLEVTAGTWKGAITGQDVDGRPLSDNCTTCHNGGFAPDMFTPWAQSGHAEILTNNLNTSTHYGEGCFDCHTVGFDPDVANGSIDEAADYADFIAAGLINNPSDANWTTVLADYPDTAQLANIQCENCHGPNPDVHASASPERISISSDVCGSCHGEPLRHARFQQWQLSAHANYTLAIDEGESGNCSRCHTGNGFLAWLPILLDDDPQTDPAASIDVTWAPDEVHPQTCVTCHDPHAVGTTTGVGTDATVRVFDDTPPLIAGFSASGVGNGAICMTCHNSRRGLRNDDTWVDTADDRARAPHGSAQTDVLMGENAYFVGVGTPGNHASIEDTCVNCHMEQTPPPDLLAYNLGGTNHTFSASANICANCHGFGSETVQPGVEASLAELQGLIEEGLVDLITDEIAAGNSIDLNGEAEITDAGDIEDLVFGESRGRQAITVVLGGLSFGPFRINDVDVLDGTATSVGNLYDSAGDDLMKAGWNWNLINNDGSMGVHNPAFANTVLGASITALQGPMPG